jgi:hypothetical protein
VCFIPCYYSYSVAGELLFESVDAKRREARDSAPAGLVASMLVKRTQHFKYIIVVGWALLAAGMAGIGVHCYLCVLYHVIILILLLESFYLRV